MQYGTSDRRQAKVGILVPCYNLGQYIDEALDSLSSQTFQDFEVIVIDDGSTDIKTRKKLSSLKVPRGDVYLEPKNMGLVKVVNKYFQKLDTQYIIVLSADDKFKPTYLEEAVKFLDDHPDISAVCSWMRLFGEKRGVYKFTDDKCQLPWMLVENGFCGTSLLRKKVWLDVGEYDSSLTPHEDYIFWLSLLSKGYKLATIPKELFCYRIRHNSTSNSTSKSDNLRFKKALLQKFPSLYRKHYEFVISHAWDIIDQYDRDFVEYSVGHDWLDAEYKSQLKTITDLESRLRRLERYLGVPLLRKLKHIRR